MDKPTEHVKQELHKALEQLWLALDDNATPHQRSDGHYWLGTILGYLKNYNLADMDDKIGNPDIQVISMEQDLKEWMPKELLKH